MRTHTEIRAVDRADDVPGVGVDRRPRTVQPWLLVRDRHCSLLCLWRGGVQVGLSEAAQAQQQQSSQPSPSMCGHPATDATAALLQLLFVSFIPTVYLS